MLGKQAMWILLGSAMSFLGCANGSEQRQEFGSAGMGSAGGPLTMTGTSDGEGATDSEPTDEPTGGPTDQSSGPDSPLLDVGPGGGSGSAEGGQTDEGCKKVDVVISVDNSGSMGEEVAALQGPVFASFPEALLAVNNGIDDFQLAVIDACPKPAAFHDEGMNGPCQYSTGANYMVSSSPTLTDEYVCATELPVDGFSGQPDECIDSGDFDDDDEQPAYTAAAALSDPLEDTVNAGFLRDDALLFVVTITDEDEALVDVPSVEDIYAQLVAAKGGDVGRVVYLGIGGGSSCDGVYGSAKHAQSVEALAELFAADDRGMFWDLCQGQLDVAFQTAIETLVDSACVEFVPEG